VQILHPCVGSIRYYSKEISSPDRYRPDPCPHCEARRPLTSHSFYCLTLVDVKFDESIRVRRYLCRCCKARCHCCRSLFYPISAQARYLNIAEGSLGGEPLLSDPGTGSRLWRHRPTRRRAGGSQPDAQRLHRRHSDSCLLTPDLHIPKVRRRLRSITFKRV
jgi:hypothetical protein